MGTTRKRLVAAAASQLGGSNVENYVNAASPNGYPDLGGIAVTS